MGLFSLLFGTSHKARAQRDQWKPRVFGKNIISPINSYGTCFSCNSTGKKVLDCRPCQGRGRFKCRRCARSGVAHLPAQTCFGCNGSGRHSSGSACRRCSGSGAFPRATTKACKCSTEEGRKSLVCRKCAGTGTFTVTCRKCEGSGWHRFKR
jgi:DnaJ-class molecular chaperone